MTTRYKNVNFQRIFDGMLALAADKASELWTRDGRPRRGAAQRCAFWDGYMGAQRSPLNVPATMSAVCYQAGRMFAKKNPGIVGCSAAEYMGWIRIAPATNQKGEHA